MSVAINGRREEIPGLDTRSFLDAGGPPHAAHYYSAAKHARFIQPIEQVGVHTTSGKRGCAVALGPDGSPLVAAEETVWRFARYYAKKDSRHASCQLWIGSTGLVLCTVDLGSERAWHIGPLNGKCIGIEMEQRADGTVHEATYRAAEILVPWLCRRFAVPMRVPARGGKPIAGVCKNVAAYRGVLGHRNATTNRGPGDPGSVVFERLMALGFEGVDPDAVP
jgi:hypothetical protein